MKQFRSRKMNPRENLYASANSKKKTMYKKMYSIKNAYLV